MIFTKIRRFIFIEILVHENIEIPVNLYEYIMGYVLGLGWGKHSEISLILLRDSTITIIFNERFISRNYKIFNANIYHAEITKIFKQFIVLISLSQNLHRYM